MQKKYAGPYRVTDKNGQTCLTLRGLKTKKELKVHLDRVKVVDEDNLTHDDSSAVRKAYPTDGYYGDVPEFHPFEFYTDETGPCPLHSNANDLTPTPTPGTSTMPDIPQNLVIPDVPHIPETPPYEPCPRDDSIQRRVTRSMTRRRNAFPY